MSEIRILIERLVDAGVDPIEAAEVITRAAIVGASEVPQKRSAGAIRQERYRRNKASLVTESDASPSPDKESPPTPPKEINPYPETSSLRSDVSAEPEKSAPPSSPVVAKLPAVSGDEVPITEADVAEWSDAFPAVDVRRALAEMRVWLNANPSRRKTARGMKRFVVSWLSREQDKPRPSSNPRASPHRQTIDEIMGPIEEELGIGRGKIIDITAGRG